MLAIDTRPLDGLIRSTLLILYLLASQQSASGQDSDRNSAGTTKGSGDTSRSTLTEGQKIALAMSVAPAEIV